MARRVLMMSARKRRELKKGNDDAMTKLRKEHAQALSTKLTAADLRKEKRGDYKPGTNWRKATSVIPSVNSTECATEKKEVLRYTGDKLIGVALMHKSNYVPIFTNEEAVSVARMRRN